MCEYGSPMVSFLICDFLWENGLIVYLKVLRKAGFKY